MQVIKSLIFSLLRLKSERKLADPNNVAFDPLKPIEREGRMPMIKQEFMPVVIFELGRLVCYTYQTQQELVDKKPYSSVYWKFKDMPEHNGPFPNIYSAMKHYTYILESTKAVTVSSIPKDNILPFDFQNNVIKVDFVAKRRV